MPIQKKQLGSKLTPGKGTTSYILSRLLAGVLDLKVCTIQSMFSRQGIRLSNIDDVVQFLRDRITPPPKAG